jgi:hypothetical protein
MPMKVYAEKENFVYLLVFYLTALSVVLILLRRMIRLLMNNKIDGMA